MDIEVIAMQLVGNAGKGKSLAFAGVAHAKNNEFDLAQEKLKKSKKS